VAPGGCVVRRRVAYSDHILVAGTDTRGAPAVVGVQQRAVVDAIEHQLLVRNVDETGELAGDLRHGGFGTGVDGQCV
jgi:hypothetical protein